MIGCPDNVFRVGQTWRNSKGYLWTVEWYGFGKVHLRAGGSGRRITKKNDSIPSGWVLVGDCKSEN